MIRKTIGSLSGKTVPEFFTDNQVRNEVCRAVERCGVGLPGQIPEGNSPDPPITGEGSIRYNPTLGQVEVWNGTTWLFLPDESDLDDILQEANEYTDEQIVIAILTANGYTDTQIQNLVSDAVFGGSRVPASNPAPTVNTWYLATQAGTYTNMGGLVVSANSFAIISFLATGSVWSISQTPLDLSGYVSDAELTATGLLELITMQKALIAQDNFSTPGTWVSNPSFPTPGLTPTFTSGAMQLDFTSGTNQSVIFSGVTLVIGQKIEITIDIRRTAGASGRLDIGSTFGTTNNSAETNPYRTLLGAEITSSFKTFTFNITPTGTTFLIGLNTSKNVGDNFEIDNVVIRKPTFVTQAATDIYTLKQSAGVIASTATTAELQAFINANRYVKLGQGTFTLTAALTIPANTIIEGFGASTILKLGAGATWNCIDLTAASTNIIIRNITFEGLAAIAPGTVTRTNILAPLSSGNSGIFAVGLVINARIEGCNFSNFSWAGLHFYNMHTSSVYSRKVYVTNCNVESCYYGILSRTRAEYISFVGNSACNNKYGAYIAAGNDYLESNQFNANACNVVLSGTAGQNDSHGSIRGGSMNHAISFNLYVIDINNGFIIDGVNMFASEIVLDNTKGAMIQNNIIQGGNISVINVDPTHNSYNVIRNNIIVPTTTITGDLTKVSMSGNRYLDGSDSTTLNNNV